MEPVFLSHYLLLCAHCIPVKGAKRSIIYDLQRQTFDFIPNDLYDFLLKNDKDKISDVFLQYSIADQVIIGEYLDFLIDKEYIFLIENKDELTNFPSMDLHWEIPSIISNAIIDFSDLNIDILNYKKLFQDLESLGCLNIQIRFFSDINQDFFFQILNDLENHSILYELIIPFEQRVNEPYYFNLYRTYTKMSSIIVFGVPDVEKFEHTDIYVNLKENIFFTNEIISDSSHCGNILSGYFSINVETYTESLKFNSCLNRKLGIDKFGNIKNCPSMTETFGNILNGDLPEIVNSLSFQKIWNVNKDMIDTCKICEFRYMCTDCRAFVENQNDKPLKCSYNPLTCEW